MSPVWEGLFSASIIKFDNEVHSVSLPYYNEPPLVEKVDLLKILLPS